MSAAPGWGEPTGTRTRLLLVRHGEVEEDWKTILYGGMDVPLSARGREQSERAAAWLAERHAPTAILSSDLARARYLADAIHARRPTAAREILPALRERHFGAWQGLPMPRIQSEWPEAYRAYIARRWEAKASPDAENLADVAARAMPAVERAIAAHAGGTVAIVGHSGPLRAILGVALRLPGESLFAVRLDYCSVTELEHWSDGTWIATGVNHTHFLANP